MGPGCAQRGLYLRVFARRSSVCVHIGSVHLCVQSVRQQTQSYTLPLRLNEAELSVAIKKEEKKRIPYCVAPTA